MFLADVVAVHAAQELLTDGMLRPDKSDFVSYIFSRYFAAGNVLGVHGFT